MEGNMKKFALALLVLTLVAGLGGCVKMHSTTDIAKDGSGTSTIEFGISKSIAEALKEMAEMEGNKDEMEMPALEDINRDKIEEAIKPYDVKLTKFERSSADEREVITMTFAFENLKGLSAAMAAAMGESPEQGWGIYDSGDGNYVLKQANYDFSDWPVPEEEEEEAEEAEPATPAEQDPAQMQKQMEIMGKLMQSMSELDVALSITVPGDIVESNAPVQEGRTSMWTINASNMMTAGQDMDPVITFSGEGLKIKDALTE